MNLGIITTLIGLALQVGQGVGKVDPLRRRVLGETPVADPTWFCISKLKAGKKWQTMNTPGYPKKLNMKHSRCTWKISSPGKSKIRIAFRGIGLAAADTSHCSSNYIEIIDETLGKSQRRYCGRKTEGDIVSQGNRLRIDLQVDPSEEYQRGFSVSYMSTKAKPGFYAKKTFNEKPLPPLKPPKPVENERKVNKEAEKSKAGSDSGRDMVPVLTADGQIVMKSSQPSKRQISSYENDKRDFKRLSGSSASSGGGMSTLVIVGIVVGGAIGLLIIVLILRKIIMNKRKKKKDRNDMVIQTNSGLPKINMNNEGAAKAKRNIMSPTVVLEKQSNPNDLIKDAHESDRGSSPSVPDEMNAFPPEYKTIYRDDNRDGRENESQSLRQKRRSTSRRSKPQQDLFRKESVAKEGRLHPGPESSRRRKPSQIEYRNDFANKIAGSNSKATGRKRPYRYNDKRNQLWDHSGAIEALNNERFCGGETYELTQANQHPRANNTIPTRQSQVFSDLTEKANQNMSKRSRSLTRRKGELFRSHREHPTANSLERMEERRHSLGRVSHLPEEFHCRENLKDARQGRPGRLNDKQHWDIRRQHETQKLGKEGGVVSRSHSTRKKKIPNTRQNGPNNGPGNEKNAVMHQKSRFIPEPSPPILPRHVVPSSRR